MKTITHCIDHEGLLGDGKDQPYSIVHDDDATTYGFRASFYAIGYDKPNYPMPALYDDYSNPNVWDCALGYHVNFG